jgi:hypothetical protein
MRLASEIIMQRSRLVRRRMLRRAQVTPQTGGEVGQPNDILSSRGVAVDRRRSRNLEGQSNSGEFAHGDRAGVTEFTAQLLGQIAKTPAMRRTDIKPFHPMRLVCRDGSAVDKLRRVNRHQCGISHASLDAHAPPARQS